MQWRFDCYCLQFPFFQSPFLFFVFTYFCLRWVLIALARGFLVAVGRSYSVVVLRLHIAVASLVGGHRLQLSWPQ